MLYCHLLFFFFNTKKDVFPLNYSAFNALFVFTSICTNSTAAFTKTFHYFEDTNSV